jgi:ADP-heptose:LPS heptosyltransferase
VIVKTDCRYFPGDHPCDLHKETGVLCAACEYYAPRGKRILIVKLDALGDVLRTTSLLPALHRAYGECYVTWVTSSAAAELFIGNHMVQEVLCADSDYLAALLTREFDVVINPDAAPRSCEIAAVARAQERFGFGISPDGYVVPLNEAAEEWLAMGACDPLKRNNVKTYQQIIHDICGLNPLGQHIVLNLTDDEKAEKRLLPSKIGMAAGGPVIGINTGAGQRWENKKWRPEGFSRLIENILEETDASVVLLGGAGESRRNSRIRSGFTERVFDPGPGSLRQFFQAIDLCDVVVTGDTLALHAALGLKKRVVAIFGPTSHQEVDLYEQGVKVVSPIECTACYRQRCDRRPNCMDLISVDQVYDGLVSQLELIACQPVA